MAFPEGCLVCAEELVYNIQPQLLHCLYCGEKMNADVSCPNGHFICDTCHSSDAFDLIEIVCNQSLALNPKELSSQLMKSPKLKMHGPEHHYLVPAVLLTAYYNRIQQSDVKFKALKLAKERASKVPGGFCGSHGNCGAAVGTGIFISIVTKTTPLSGKTWNLSNRITAKTLLKIADSGGPRCCKRDTYIAIDTAVEFLKNEMDTELDNSDIICEFSARNNQCLNKGCRFYDNAGKS